MTLSVKISIKKETILNLLAFFDELVDWYPDISPEVLFHISSDEIVLDTMENDVFALLKKNSLTKLNNERPAWDLRLTLNLLQLAQMCKVGRNLLKEKDIPIFMLSFQTIDNESGVYFQDVSEDKVWPLLPNSFTHSKF